MKKKIFLLVFYLPLIMNGQTPSIQLSKCLGSPQGNDIGTSILQTNDGGYVVACTTGYYSPQSIPPVNGENGDITGENGNGFRIFRLGATGNIVWQTYVNGTHNGSPATSVLTSMVATNDGSYIVMGTSDANGWGLGSYWSAIALAKISSNGNIIWKKMCTVEYNGCELNASSIKNTSDGGYIITGRASHGTVDNGQYFLIKLDSNGNNVWFNNNLGSYQYDTASDVIQCPDGGYLISGFNVHPEYGGYLNYVFTPKGGQDIWVVKVDSLGNYIWSKNYGGSGTEWPGKLLKTLDGGYLITGTTDSNNLDVSNNHGGMDIWIVKINSIGDILWQKTYGGTNDDSISDIFQSNDGNYVFSSSTKSNNGDVLFNHGNNKSDSWLVKIDQTGMIIWQKTIGGTGTDDPNSIIQTIDGGYALTGSTNSTDGDIIGYHSLYQTPLDIYIIKLSQDNLSNNIFSNQDKISIYPNPANDHITIDCGTLANVSGWNLKITNILGQEVFNQPMNTQQYVVPLNTWTGQGIYFVKIYDAQGTLVNTKKILLQ